MDLALNNQQRLICHKTQTTNQPTILENKNKIINEVDKESAVVILNKTSYRTTTREILRDEIILI